MPKYNLKKAFFGKRNKKFVKRIARKAYSKALSYAIKSTGPYSAGLSLARKGINRAYSSYRKR